MSENGIQLVVFDLGRVLIRICDNWQHAWKVAGLESTPATMDERANKQLFTAVCDSEVGKIDRHGFSDAASQVMGVPAQHVQRMTDVYLIEPFPGAAELIDEIHAKGLKTACLSNTNENHWQQMFDPALVHHNVMKRLGRCFASHLIGARKPDEKIYEHVERECQVGGSQIVFFDDLKENIEAAARRGWDAVQIEITSEPVAQMQSALRARGIL